MLNIAVLMGRLTAEPELRHTPNNTAVTRFTIAVERSYVKAGEERRADFIDVIAWRHTAEFICKYFRKGQMIALRGTIQTRSYTDSHEIKRKAVEIVADNVHFAGSKLDNSSESAVPSTTQQPSSPPPEQVQFQNTWNEDEIKIGDDDLPF